MWDQCHEQGESVDSRDKADHRCVFGMKGSLSTKGNRREIK